jgi:hypothetical protein
MRHYLAWAGVLALSVCAIGAQAHHSMAMFDQTKTIKLTGTVREFQWTNPHCYIQLLVKDASGKDVEWSLEMGAPMYLYAAGWRPSTLKNGMPITVTVNPLKDGKPGAVVITATMADGKQLGKGVPLSKAPS